MYSYSLWNKDLDPYPKAVARFTDVIWDHVSAETGDYDVVQATPAVVETRDALADEGMSNELLLRSFCNTLVTISKGKRQSYRFRPDQFVEANRTQHVDNLLKDIESNWRLYGGKS
jgi:hypothetical protein